MVIYFFNLGIELLEIGKKFILNPSSDELRSMSVRVGQSVLMAVVRVLIIADMFDVDLILKQIEKVCGILPFLTKFNARAWAEINQNNA